MSSQNQESDRSTTDQILDLLLDALAERQRNRHTRRETAHSPTPETAGKAPRADEQRDPEPRVPPAGPEPVPAPRPEPPAAPPPRPQATGTTPPPRQLVQPRPVPPPFEPKPGDEGWTPAPRLPSINMGRMLWRLALLIAVLIVLVNIPVNRYGVSLARILPESASMIIRNGSILKGSGPEIYRLEDDRLR